MLVYRICDEKELFRIFENRSIQEVGKFYYVDSQKNTHCYQAGKRYLHFFEKYEDVFYLNSRQKKYICTYDLSKEVLENCRGVGYYLDRVFFRYLQSVPEFAVNSILIHFDDLKQIDEIVEEISFEEYVDREVENKIVSIYTITDSKMGSKILKKEICNI